MAVDISCLQPTAGGPESAGPMVGESARSILQTALHGQEVVADTLGAQRTYGGQTERKVHGRRTNGEEVVALASLDGRATVQARAFFDQLRREKRRSDRFKTPLSIALFTPLPAKHDASLDRIGRALRETDTLGLLSDGRIGVILPDTDAAGRTRFTDRIAKRAYDLSVSITGATYPHDVFDRLLEQDGGRNASPLLFADAPSKSACARFVKRTIDFLFALGAIVFLGPVMAAVAVGVALTSPGPIIYRQVRLGFKGVPFVFYKFRSMYADADERVHREFVTRLIRQGEHAAGSGAAPTWSKMKKDARITPFGAFLRRTSMDELPQLFNVLKGDLSLVGPRPPLLYEVEQYEPWHLRRIMETRPGISGLWQVESRGEATFEDMVRMDLRYIRDWSLKLDLKILVKTVKVVLLRNGAG